MKKFLLHLGFFVLLCLVSTQIISIIIIKSQFAFYWGYPGNEIYKSIIQSKKTENASKLILGDSVSRQFNPPGKISDSVVSLPCNQAISMCGQYILLREYLKKNESPKVVELQLTPSSLRNNLDQPYTYHYFLKPFYNSNYKDYLDIETLEIIRGIPFHRISQIPSIKATKWAPQFIEEKKIEWSISETSIIYLRKIIQLCEQVGSEFNFIPMPVAESKAPEVNLLRNTKFNTDESTAYLVQYFNDIRYYPDSLFTDGIHLKNITTVNKPTNISADGF